MKKKKEPKKVGRPTDYRPEYSKIAFKACLLKNSTDKELAQLFGISEQTINSWKKKYPEFLESIKKGKEEADEEVVNALRERALGYNHEEDKIFLGPRGKPIIVPTIKYYPPDPTAAIFWLKNRQPEKWKDRQELAVNGKLQASGGRIFTDLELAARLSYLIELAIRRKKEHDALAVKETGELPEKLNEGKGG